MKCTFIFMSYSKKISDIPRDLYERERVKQQQKSLSEAILAASKKTNQNTPHEKMRKLAK